MSGRKIKRSVRVQVTDGSGTEKQDMPPAAGVGSRREAECVWPNSLAKHGVKRGLGLIAFMVSAIIAVTASGQESGHSFGNPDVLQWAPSRTYHVENYKLKLRFDQLKGEVFGDETVKLRPIQPHFHKFYLNSSELTIRSKLRQAWIISACGRTVRAGELPGLPEKANYCCVPIQIVLLDRD
jgi:hypothetical protein